MFALQQDFRCPINDKFLRFSTVGATIWSAIPARAGGNLSPQISSPNCCTQTCLWTWWYTRVLAASIALIPNTDNILYWSHIDPPMVHGIMKAHG